MSKFRVGDMVRIIESWAEEDGSSDVYIKGAICTIDQHHHETPYIKAKTICKCWSGGIYIYEHNIEHARIRNTKIARKMNPTYKVIDENWLEYRGNNE